MSMESGKYITPRLISTSDIKQCGYEKTGDTVWLLILAGNVPNYLLVWNACCLWVESR